MSHAANLADGTPDPIAGLAHAVRQLGAWADLNPALRGLHSEFETHLAGILELNLRSQAAKEVTQS